MRVPPSSSSSANDRYLSHVGAPQVGSMPNGKCTVCGGPLEPGFVATTNGSGLFWSHQATTSRFRPKGLEVLVGTGFGGTYSANLPGLRCPHCHTIILSLPEGKSA